VLHVPLGLLAAISYNPIVHIKLGPLNISPHGVGIAVGFLCGAFLMLPAARERGIEDDTVFALLTRAAIGSIIGARLAYVVNHLGDYESPLEILQIWKGGISLLGGFTGAIAVALPEMRSRRLSFWKVMDAAAPGMALGVIVGRIGDLIVGDHLGTPTRFALGYLCPRAETASPCVPGQVVHQTALYDMGLTIILLGVLLFVRRKPRYDGFLILVFGLGYGIQRLIEDFLREDVRHFGLTGSQWTACTAGLLCLYVLVFRRRTPWWGHWDERPPDEDEDEDHDEEQEESTVAEPVSEETTSGAEAVEPESEDEPADEDGDADAENSEDEDEDEDEGGADEDEDELDEAEDEEPDETVEQLEGVGPEAVGDAPRMDEPEAEQSTATEE
jgi:phosphatidylglycerol---prolipoprotein diacylglyceryl transferase